jgi:hypothetical protein
MKDIPEAALQANAANPGNKPETVTVPIAVAIVMEIPFPATTPAEVIVKAAGGMPVVTVRIPERPVLATFAQIMDKDLQAVVRPVKDFLYV